MKDGFLRWVVDSIIATILLLIGVFFLLFLYSQTCGALSRGLKNTCNIILVVLVIGVFIVGIGSAIEFFNRIREILS
jgi:membrane-bound ClpP family serine protease